MQIHALRCGQMSVKSNYVAAKGNNRLMRLTSSLIDTSFKEIPIYAWVIGSTTLSGGDPMREQTLP